jgi:transcriptional regulator with XRE-family HTH domain
MKQDGDLDTLVRQRIRGLRVALGWSLDELAGRSYLSPSTLSRIETGHRRIALDQLTPIARALGTTLDQLVESGDDDDVVIRPLRDEARGLTTWLLSRAGTPAGLTVAKLRVTRPVPARLRVHPGRDWFTVLSGAIVLRLGERTILVQAGEAAEFSTMVPHAFGARDGAAEVLAILDHDGQRTHLGPSQPAARELDALLGRGVGPPVVVLVEDLAEHRLAGGGVQEQRHRGAQLERVDLAEDLLRGTARQPGQDGGTFDQPRTQNRVRQVGPGLLQAGDGVRLGRRAVPQAGDLREDEPHPVAGLAAVPQLGRGPPVGAAGLLGRHEPLQIVRVVRLHARPFCRSTLGISRNYPRADQ